MAIETKKYLDLAGLTHFWENIKDYIDNKSISATAIETLIGKVAGDDALSARQITEDVLIKALIPEDAKESLDTLEEIAKWIQNHPDDVATMSGNIAKIAEEVELDPTSLEYDDVYENTKTVRGDIVGTKDKFEKIAEEVELNPDTHEYTGVYATTNSVYSDLVAAKGEIGGLKNTITDIKGLSYAEIDAAMAATVVPNYLKFTAVEDSTIILGTFDADVYEIIDETPVVNLEYSMNGIDFQQWNYETQLYAGQTLYLRGDNPSGFGNYPITYSFGASTGKFECQGNIMSLLYKDDFEGKLTIPCDYCFSYLFANFNYDNTEAYALLTAPELPATTLTDWCYSYMFSDCASLTAAPELPATELTDWCYSYMFSGCASLTAASELPAMTLAEGCYTGMFNSCTSLTTAPEILPATTLTVCCYEAMFNGCTSLTTAPELPATTLTVGCYYSMFQICTSLTTAPELPATTLAMNCYGGMFWGCTSLTTAPELPATTLTEGCYSNMFVDCSKLNYIKMLATNISAKNCLSAWVRGVASTGTLIKHPDMTSLPSGSSGIPSGWTAQDAA